MGWDVDGDGFDGRMYLLFNSERDRAALACLCCFKPEDHQLR